MKKFPLILLIALFLILGTHIVAVFASLYYIFWWFDIVLHFLGGAWVASALYYFLFSSWKAKFFLPPLFICITLVSMTVLVGVLWEFFEFGLDSVVPVFGVVAKGKTLLADTLLDLLMDIIGGSVAGVFFIWKKRIAL